MAGKKELGDRKRELILDSSRSTLKPSQRYTGLGDAPQFQKGGEGSLVEMIVQREKLKVGG